MDKQEEVGDEEDSYDDEEDEEDKKTPENRITDLMHDTNTKLAKE